jgi:hypothetical protein
MIRVIVRSTDIGAACHVGGPVSLSFATFDLEAPDLEAALRRGGDGYLAVEAIGIHVIEPAPETQPDTQEDPS